VSDLPRRAGLDYGEWASGGLMPPRRDDWLGPFRLDAIYQGDARKLAKYIPDESVDLIFTDPVYDRIDDYRWLAETAARVLKPNRACLAFCAIGSIPETHDALRAGGLFYRWRLVVRPVNSKEFNGRLMITSQECLWYEKGKSPIHKSLFDVQMSTIKGHYEFGGSNWGKGIDALARFVDALTRPGNLVLDTFGGSGSIAAVCRILGRRYLAFEIDHQTCLDARQRVALTQPPLFTLEPEQLSLPGVAA
jgi:DNA modification methylase